MYSGGRLNSQVSKSTDMNNQIMVTGSAVTSVKNHGTSANVANTMSSPRKNGMSARNMESSNHKTPNYYSKINNS